MQVNNTDAEGRLTLADALVYASELKVDKVYSIHPLSSIILTSDSIHASATQDTIAVLTFWRAFLELYLLGVVKSYSSCSCVS